MKNIHANTFVALTLGCTSALVAGEPVILDGVSIVNTVEECVAVIPKNIEKTAIGLVLHTQVDFHKSTAECGCLSALLSYSVFEKLKVDGDEVEYERLSAQKISPEDKISDYPFLISADPELDYSGEVVLTVGCKSPD